MFCLTTSCTIFVVNNDIGEKKKYLQIYIVYPLKDHNQNKFMLV